MRREEADSKQFQATSIVLAELADLLEKFEGAVIAGGNVPFLLIPQDIEAHEGTVDVDVVLDPDRLRSDSHDTLHDILVKRLFNQDEVKPFRYEKLVKVEGEHRFVLLELLTGGTRPHSGLRRIAIEDVHASVIEGMEIALDRPVRADVPGGATVVVTSMAGFLTMKAVALDNREDSKKQKDAYDIVYCLRNYPGGVDAIAEEIIDRLPNSIIEHGLAILAEHFSTTTSLGPVAYSRRANNKEEESRMRREAFERVSDLLDRLP